MGRRALQAILLAALLLMIGPTALAQETTGDRLVVGSEFVLQSGEVLKGNLAVAGGSAVLQRGSIVSGDVAVLGGALTVEGTILGSVALFGGSADLADSAVIQGDLANFGGSLRRAPNATIRGEVFSGLQMPQLAPLLARPDEEGGEVRTGAGVLGRLLRWQLGTLAAVALAVVLALAAALFAPRAVERVAGAAQLRPALCFGAGLLTLAVAALAGALLLLCLGLGLVLWLLSAVGLVVGWSAVGLWVGKRLLAALHVRTPTLLAQVAAGVAVITLAARLPLCVGFLVGLILGAIGLGAVVLTRFGTMEPQVVAGDQQPEPAAPASEVIEIEEDEMTARPDELERPEDGPGSPAG